jgi:uncharacterized protein YndB with AHSA1/START domain
VATIRHFVEIRSDADTVYRALTEQDGLSSWWTKQTVATPEVGGFAEFRFGEQYYNKFRITRLAPGSAVEWECLEGDPQWIGTTFMWLLEEKNGHTTLRFRHDKWREETDFFASCNYHWGYYIRSLKLYCETGEGYPFSPDE